MTHNISDYNKCAYVQTAKAKKAGWFTLLFICISALLIFSMSDFISGMISGRGSMVWSGKIDLKSFSLYAIEIGQYSDFNEAQQVSDKLKSQGAAGYIYHSGDYHVFVSMYDNYADAEQVKNNLENSGQSSKIFTISMPRINIEIGDESIKEAIGLYRNSYSKLYELSIGYDGGDISKLKVTTDINDIKSTFEKASQSVYDIVLESNNATAVLLKNSLDKIVQILEYTIKINSDGYDFNSAIKKCYFEVIFEYLQFAKKV